LLSENGLLAAFQDGAHVSAATVGLLLAKATKAKPEDGTHFHALVSQY